MDLTGISAFPVPCNPFLDFKYFQKFIIDLALEEIYSLFMIHTIHLFVLKTIQLCLIKFPLNLLVGHFIRLK